MSGNNMQQESRGWDDFQQQMAADASVDERASFVVKTYANLFGALLAFLALEIVYFSTSIAETVSSAVLGASWGFMGAIGGAMVVGWVATRVAHNVRSKPMQYAALGGYVLAESLCFLPLLYIARNFYPNVLLPATVITATIFAALTAVVFITRKDFSFLRGVLMLGFFVVLIAAVAGMIFGVDLGIGFTIFIIFLAAGAILYDTSNVMLHYPLDREVGASLQLFASFTTLLWHVIVLLMRMSDD